MIEGRPKGLPLDQRGRRRGPAQEGQGTSLVPRGREERAYQPPGGAGKTRAVLGRKEPKTRKLAAWSPTRVEWDKGILNPCEGERGKIGETLGNSENGTAPPALILADL